MKQNLFALAVLLLLAACGHDTLPDDNPAAAAPTALRILSVSTEQGDNAAASPATRATTLLTEGAIGVFRAASTSPTGCYPTADVNYPYVYNPATGWQADYGLNIYLIGGEPVNVSAYFPYDNRYRDCTAIPLIAHQERLTGISAYDIRFASQEMTAVYPSVNFAMKHAHALLEFVFHKRAGSTNTVVLEQVEISASSGLCTTATVDITNGTYGNRVIAPADKLTFPQGTGGAGLTVTTGTPASSVGLMLIPFTLPTDGLKASFTVQGINTSTVTLPKSLFDDGELKASYHYKVYIALNGMTVEKVEAEPWGAVTVEDTGNKPFEI